MIELVEKLLEEGKKAEARNLALRSYKKSQSDISYHVKFGEIFEDLGFGKKAIECYNNAIRLDPGNLEALTKLGSLLYEVGQLDRSLHIWRRVLERNPDDETAKDYLERIYQEMGLKGAKGVVSNIKEEKSPLRYFPPNIGKVDTENFLRLFMGSKVGYFEGKLDRTGKLFLVYHNKQLDHEVVKDHLLGRRTIYYSLLIDSKVKSSILEVKIPKKDVISNLRNPSMLGLKVEKLKDFSLSILKKLKGFDLPAYLERISPYRYRIWLFLEEPVHLLFSKRFLKALIGKLPIPEMGLSLDMLLPTKSAFVGWKENPIILPLAVDLQRGERLLFLNEDGDPYPDQLKFLKKIQEVPVKVMKDFLKGEEVTSRVKVERISALGKLRSLCPVIDVIVKKAEAGRILSRNEKVVLYFTCGLVEPEGRLLHEVLFPCPDYKYEKVKRELKNLRPNPISCLKIREMVPEIANSVDCNCIFDLSDGRYPSPLLHVNRLLVPTEDEKLTLKHKGFRGLLKSYIDLLLRREEIEDKINRVEKELIPVFEKKTWYSYEIGGFRITYDRERKKLNVKKVG